MKHVRESLNQYYDYKFFRVFEEDAKADLQTKEKDGLAVIEKLKKNFEDFKKNSKDEILKWKEFWEENKKTKEGFTESGDVYKLFDSDYVVGVLELPVETLSDGSIDGGFGATDEPEEEIIEGPEIGAEEETIEEEPKEDFYEEQQVPNKVTEAAETGDDLKDLGAENPAEEAPVEEEPEEDPTDNAVEIPELPDTPEEGGEDLGDLGGEEPVEDMPVEEPMSSEPAPDLTAPQTYFVVYDISGDEREEIFRCGSNNVVNAFKSFYNDTFKGGMKNAILKYKEAKELEKKEAEKAEKAKEETSKDSKLKKFLGESQMAYLNAVHAVSKLDEGYSDMLNRYDEEYDEEEDESFYEEDDARFDEDGREYYIVNGKREYADEDELDEKYKGESDPIKDMGIGQTLEEELEEKDLISVSDLKEFDLEDENTATWSGNLVHPMTGYGGKFDYLHLTVTLTKEGPKKYVVTQEGERRNGEFYRYEQRQLDDGDLEVDEDNIEDFEYDVDHEIDDRDEFKTLEEAIEYIDSDGCLDFQG